jgi:hypothetical protein
MIKYLYLLGLAFSLLTFIVGFGNFIEKGLNIFSLGFMSMTPVIAFVMTSLHLKKKRSKK